MSELIPRFEQRIEDRATMGPKQLPTAGAIRVKNEKGEIVMKKIKVTRYTAGQIPKYAENNESESEDDDFTQQNISSKSRSRHDRPERSHSEHEHRHRDGDSNRSRDEDVRTRHHHKHEIKEEEEIEVRHHERSRRRRRDSEEEAPREEEQMSDDEDDEYTMQRRREEIRLRRLHGEIKEEVKYSKLRSEQEVLKREHEELTGDEANSEESSEEESEEESSDDDAPNKTLMLKPVFVKKRDRVTLIEAEEESKRMEQLRLEEEKQRQERKKESDRILKETLKREDELKKQKNEDQTDLNSVNTDDENEEVAYELWKIREIKRLMRNREERETMAREKAEIDKVHGMTEEQRKEYLRLNPKIVTNKAEKGKYKFLQKYFHRGAFFLDQEDEVLKRDFAAATGEDEFDKSVLPQVMQVKNFGQAGRSKWTHLTAEDTTDHQGIWATETSLSSKFVTRQAAGMKNIFERPAAKKRRRD